MTGSKNELWQTDSLSRLYIEEVRLGIPLAVEQIDVMLRLIEATGQNVARFADLGCGNGFLASAILSRYPTALGFLVDFSEPMLKEARQNLESYAPQLRFVLADLGDHDWIHLIEKSAPFDAVVSGYAIHHLTDERKRQLYREIFGLLAPGGVFVNLDHVSSPTNWVESISDEVHVDSLHAFHAKKGSVKTREEIVAKYVHRPDQEANILAPAEAQCDWLRAIGFQDVDCYLKVFERAVFGGRRPDKG